MYLDGGRKLVYGTDTGVFISERRPKVQVPNTKPRKVLDLSSVTQIDVLEEYQLLLVLSAKMLLSYPLEVLDPSESQSPLVKRPKKIQNHANFFKAGVCMGRHLVCSAKMSGISTTIKVFEPNDQNSRVRRPALSKMFQSGQEALKPFKVILLHKLFDSSADLSIGVLRPRGIVLHRLFALQALRLLLSWIRSRQSGNVGDATATGPGRYLARFRQPERDRAHLD